MKAYLFCIMIYLEWKENYRLERIKKNEIWKDIKGYPNYEVSSMGNVKSLKYNKERILKKCMHKDGYEFVNLYINGKQIYCNVHQLVAIAFLGYVQDGTLNVVVDHKNNVSNDNKLYNLQLTTQRINTSKDKKKGTSKYTGVSFEKRTNKWVAQIYKNKKQIKIGSFTSELSASIAYQKELIAI